MTIVCGLPSNQLTEAQWQAQVIDLARLHGWLIAHFGAAMVQRKGKTSYRTPVRADGMGFPDLVLVHEKRGVIFRELKTDKGRLSEHQKKWIERLRLGGADVDVWRPKDFDRVHDELRAPRATASLPSEVLW